MMNLLATSVATLGQWLWLTHIHHTDGDSMTAILTTCAVGALSVMSVYAVVNTMLYRWSGGILGNRSNGSIIVYSWSSWLLWVVFFGGLFVLYHHFCLFLWFAIIWAVLYHGMDYTPTQDATGLVIVVATLLLAWLLRRSQNVLGIGRVVEKTLDTMLLSFWHVLYAMGQFVLITTPKTLLKSVWQVALALTRALVFVVGTLLLPISAARRLVAVLDVSNDDDDNDDDDYEYESESDEPFDEDDYEAEDVSLLHHNKKKKKKEEAGTQS